MTPKQACPRPDGLGRNLRSKTRWFTGFCNSHQVSHFATFFIDARAKISVVESRKDSLYRVGPPRAPSLHRQLDARRYPKALFLGAHRAGCLFGAPSNAKALVGGDRWAPRRQRGKWQAPPPNAPCGCVDEFTIVRSGLDNDPSAGSPTETLLRLLLPLNDKVQWTSRDVGGGGPPPSPRSEHFTGPFNR